MLFTQGISASVGAALLLSEQHSLSAFCSGYTVSDVFDVHQPAHMHPVVIRLTHPNRAVFQPRLLESAPRVQRQRSITAGADGQLNHLGIRLLLGQ